MSPSGEDRSGLALSWTAALCSLALFLPLAWPLATGQVFVFDDLGNFHLPMRYLYANALRDGHLLLWTPAVSGGLYLHGEGQLGMLHPAHLLAYRVLPLTVAFNLEFLANYAAAFAGMFWLLRRLGLTAGAALFGAMLFAFSGFQLLHHHHVNLVAVTAHLPWLLAFIDVLVTGDRPFERASGYAGIALVLASELLLGFPQAVWWNLLAAAGFGALRAGQMSRWRRLVPCALAGLTAAFLGAIQLLPMFDAAAHSVRSTLPASFALTYSLSPWNIAQLLSPYVFVNRAYSPTEYLQVHELGIYTGAITLIVPIWLIIRRKALGARRSLVAGAGGFAAVMFILALGRYGGLDILLTHLPGLGSLRAPARYIVLVQFALAMLAAVAFDDVIMWRNSRDRLGRADALAICSIAAASALMTALLNTRAIHLPASLPLGPVEPAAEGTAFVIAVTIAFVLAVRRVRWALAALMLVTAADIGVWGLSYVYKQPPQRMRWLTQDLPRVPVGMPGRASVEAPSADRPLLKDYQIVPGYLGLYPATQHPPEGAEFQRLAGVRWNIASDATLTSVSDALPRVRLLASANAPLAVDRDPIARVVIDQPGEIVVKMSASSPRFLALTERFDAGWHVESDGAPIDAVRVGGDFLGTLVPAGSHRVVFRFMPRSFVAGSALSALGAVFLIAGIVVIGAPRRSSERHGAERR